MPIFDLRFRIEATSTQKATTLRDKLAGALVDEDVTVISASQAQDSYQFAVAGVDLQTHEAFSETVDAPSAKAAEEQVRSKTKIVTEARPL